MAKPADFDIQKIIDYLQGTCMNTLAGTIELFHPEMTEDDLDSDDYAKIDNDIFECEECGWWCETSQYGEEDGKCEDCSPEDED